MTIKRGEFIALLGPSGLRQVDGAQLHRRPAAAVRRQHLARRHAHRHAAARAARLRHGVPELRAVSAHDGREERRLRPADARRAGGRDRAARREGAEDGAAHRPGAQAARPAFRRPAAARRDRARDRHRAAADPDGRAAVEPRRQAAHRDARRDPAHPHASSAARRSTSRTTRTRRCRSPTASS